MAFRFRDRLRLSLQSPYLWMIRGVIGLAGLLYTPWMLLLLPLAELIIQTWFEQIFKSRLEQDSPSEDRSFARQLSSEDAGWYEHIRKSLEEIRNQLPDAGHVPPVEVDVLARDVLRRLLSLRRAQALEEDIDHNQIAAELRRTTQAAEVERNERIREVLQERKALQEQRLELKQRLQARVRELGAQLKLIEEQVDFLRDTVLSSELQKGAGLDEEAQSTLKDQIDILNRQMRIASELDDEVHTMLRNGSMERTGTDPQRT